MSGAAEYDGMIFNPRIPPPGQPAGPPGPQGPQGQQGPPYQQKITPEGSRQPNAQSGSHLPLSPGGPGVPNMGSEGPDRPGGPGMPPGGPGMAPGGPAYIMLLAQ